MRIVFLLTIFAFEIVAAALSSDMQEPGKTWSPSIPKAWDDRAMQDFEIPLARPEASPKHVSADYYYRMPVRPIYRSYPIYQPGKEPAGYVNWLKQQSPLVVFESSKLKSKQDWIRAGESVFDAPIEFESSGQLYSGVRDAAWYGKNHVPITKDGIFPYMRYVVREKGKVEVGILACAQCHTRVMPNGTVIKGAQGNFPDDRAFAYETRIEAAQATDKEKPLKELRAFMKRNYSVPWLDKDPNARTGEMPLERIVTAMEGIVPGICARQGSSIFFPPHIPDLIGVKDRMYLDASGHDRHRTIADLMRYAALNQGADELSTYGGFRPKGKLPDPVTESRYSDEQLFALALYVYSLKPPPNPNRFDSIAARGKKVFEQEGCATCHTPPLYTNNMLTPVDGFKGSADHRVTRDVLQASVGTDPNLTLKTRRGTGYYKVPSLKGLWYRGPFEHNGSLATLEDFFDRRRVRQDYLPTGFRGYGTKNRAVKGHEFGLNLSPKDRQCLIRFLKTL